MADQQAVADAARNKRKEPGRPRTPRATDAAKAAEVRAAGLEQAAVDAEADLVAGLEKHREKVGKRLDHGSEAARETSREAARKLAELEAERGRLLALRRWLDDGRYLPAKTRSPEVDLRRPSGERYSLAELIPRIEAALEKPVKRPLPSPQPLKKVA